MGIEILKEAGQISSYKIYLDSLMKALDPVPLEEFITRFKESDHEAFLASHSAPFLIVFLPEIAAPHSGDQSAETAMHKMATAGVPSSLNEFVYELTIEDGETLKIGRSPSQAICVPVPQVSRTHVVLSKSPEGNWNLMDANSTCGTAINQKRIFPGSRYPLENGSMFCLGSAVDFKFHTPEGILTLLS